MNRRDALLAFAGAALAPAALARAETEPSGEELAPDAGAGIEALAQAQEYRSRVVAIGSFLTQASDILRERGRNLEIRAFAQLEIDEQAALAASLGGAAPRPAVPADQTKLLERMKAMKLSSALDRLYLESQIAIHGELLALHSAYAESGSDPVSLAVARLAVPSIATHLTMLNRLKRSRFV